MLEKYLDALLMGMRDASEFIMVAPSYERDVWDDLDGDMRALLARGREYEAVAPAALRLSGYVKYADSGDASAHNEAYLQRRTALKALTLAYCAAPEKGALIALADYAWAICEESSWCLPASNPSARGERPHPLPDPTRPLIDAASACTAADLATMCQLCENALDETVPGLNARVEMEISARVIRPFLSSADMDWMCGPKADSLKCLCGVMTAFLTFERDRKRRWQLMRKAWMLLDRLLETLPEDGSVPGGADAWLDFAEPVMDCLTMVYYVTGGEADARRELQAQLLCHYPVLCHIAEGWYVNPGARTMKPELDGAAMYRLGLAARDSALCDLGAMTLIKNGGAARPTAPLSHMVFDALNRAKILRARARPPYRRQGYLASMQLFVARMNEDDERGLALAMLGGNNGALDCHLDAGDILLVSNGAPVLVDAGYLSDTEFHNLPTIANHGQVLGAGSGATDASFQLEEDFALASLNLATAYPPIVSAWQRTLVLNRSDGSARLIEVFDLKERSQVRFHFITPFKPVIGDDFAQFADVRLRWEDGLLPMTEALPVTDTARALFNGALYRLTLMPSEPVSSGQYTFSFGALRTFG